MDLRRLRAGEWIVGGAGAALLVSLFLPWWGLRGSWIDLGPGGPVDGPGDPTAVTTWSAWQLYGVTDLLLAALALGAVATWAIVARARTSGPGLFAEALLTPFAVAMAVVVLIQALGSPGSLDAPAPVPDPTLRFGGWLGLLAVLALPVGLLFGMRDERLSRRGQSTDQTGVPVAAPPPVERLPGPPPA